MQPRHRRALLLAAAAAALTARVRAAPPEISAAPGGAAFVYGADAVGSVAIGQPGVFAISADAPVASLAVCFDRTRPYLEDEDALVPPGAESLAPAGVTALWGKSQVAPGGGCLTLTAPPVGITGAAMSELAWQVRYLNGGPLGGPTTGDRVLVLTVTDTAGEAGSTRMAVSVDNAPALAGACPVVAAAQAVDVVPTQLAGGGGVRVAGGAVVTDPDAAGVLVNAHARITGGCVPAEDVLALDAAGAPATIGSTWFPETCDLTLYATAATPAQWTAALRNVLYRNLAAGGAAVLGSRVITLSVGQAAPAACRSSYGLSQVNLLAALPTPSPPATPSAAPTPPITPSGTPTPLDFAGMGSSSTGEPAAPDGGASSGAPGARVVSAAAAAACTAAAVLLAGLF